MKGLKGDCDPLDIVVLCGPCRARQAAADAARAAEKTIAHGDVLLTCIPIGGLRMIDKDEADDKVRAQMHLASLSPLSRAGGAPLTCSVLAQIIAVMENDLVYGRVRDVAVRAREPRQAAALS